MADVFVSYNTENRPAVQLLVAGLRAQGLEVWWDQDIPPDAPWEATVEHALKGAKITIVAWSPAAVASENVKSEARWARNQGRLIQVFVAPCDPPLFFGERQGVSLEGWTGAVSDHRFVTVVAAVRAMIAGKAPPQGVGYKPPVRRPVWLWAVAVAAILAAVLAVAGLGREALCQLPAAEGVCRSLGLGPPKPSAPSPADLAAAARARTALIQSVDGAWDRQGGACASPLTIKAETDGAGVTTITVSGPHGFKSTGQVITAENGRVLTRDVEASGLAGQTSEYQPNGALMTVIDGRGVSTPLIRCSAN
jgi:hypothetical protein